MASLLTMPRLSDTMSEGVLVIWRKKEGDPIEPGDVVAEVETDKATMEMEAYEGGVLARILAQAGQAIPVGGPLAIIAEDSDDDLSPILKKLGGGSAVMTAPADQAGAEPPPPATPAAPAPASTAAVVSSASGGDGRLKASPLARRMASDHRLELSSLAGSGPGGRIVKRDIEQALDAGRAGTPEPSPTAQGQAASTLPPGPLPPAAPLGLMEGDERVPLSQMRKTIARRMTEAKLVAPHFYLTAEIDMAATMSLRHQLNQVANGSVKISVNDLVMKACAVALLEHPRINASFDGDHVVLHHAVHLGFAAAIEDGLITPTVRNAHQKSVSQLARETRELADRALARKLKPEEFTGATFTVSNLGMYGIVEFVAIINPPQAAILAVGAVREIPVVVGGQLAVGQRMRVTLSCDHRVIDGALGARFLVTLREILEQPLRLLL